MSVWNSEKSNIWVDLDAAFGLPIAWKVDALLTPENTRFARVPGVRSIRADQHPAISIIPVRLLCHKWTHFFFTLGPGDERAKYISSKSGGLSDGSLTCTVRAASPITENKPLVVKISISVFGGSSKECAGEMSEAANYLCSKWSAIPNQPAWEMAEKLPLLANRWQDLMTTVTTPITTFPSNCCTDLSSFRLFSPEPRRDYWFCFTRQYIGALTLLLLKAPPL